MGGVGSLRCPVCRAAMRAAAGCPRCGADLRPLMTVAARAWALRGEARRAIAAGDLDRAARLAHAAARCHATHASRRLERCVHLLRGGLAAEGQPW